MLWQLTLCDVPNNTNKIMRTMNVHFVVPSILTIVHADDTVLAAKWTVNKLSIELGFI